MISVERGEIDALDSAFVVVDVTVIRTHIPVGGVACLMLELGHALIASRLGDGWLAETLRLKVGRKRGVA